MSGHSKWATIKHKKGAADAKRGRVFTKLIRELSVAAKMGGSDPDSNPHLRSAILAAKGANMPGDNIERAIKKGAGELEGATYEEITFEGYGPAGIAMLVEVLTDNRNRTVAEVRHLLERHNGKMGEVGCVSWMFDKRGLIYLEKEAADENTVMDLALEAGADDVRDSGESWEVVTSPAAYEAVKTAFDEKGLPNTGELSMVPQTTIKLTGKNASSMIKLYDALEEQDDVRNVYANFDISEEEYEKLSA
jgi:YebC/PmpR family DNA-binding regulatory protein